MSCSGCWFPSKYIRARLILGPLNTGVCEGCADVLAKWGIPPKIRGRFFKSLERRGCCGYPMILDYVWMCDDGDEKKF